MDAPPSPTPLSKIALVSRIATRTVDRLTGGRADYPFLLALAAKEGLYTLGVKSQVLYGRAAWIEIMEKDEQPVWAVCEDPHPHFWLETLPAHEIVDLSLSVAFRSVSKREIGVRSILSPPMLWSSEIPRFVRYIPEGAAEMQAESEQDRKLLDRTLEVMHEKCVPARLVPEEWPNEPILCPGRKLLDDSLESFKRFDRALGVHGIPKAPF